MTLAKINGEDNERENAYDMFQIINWLGMSLGICFSHLYHYSLGLVDLDV